MGDDDDGLLVLLVLLCFVKSKEAIRVHFGHVLPLRAYVLARFGENRRFRYKEPPMFPMKRNICSYVRIPAPLLCSYCCALVVVCVHHILRTTAISILRFFFIGSITDAASSITGLYVVSKTQFPAAGHRVCVCFVCGVLFLPSTTTYVNQYTTSVCPESLSYRRETTNYVVIDCCAEC